MFYRTINLGLVDLEKDENLLLNDIAHALSRICCYNGHTNRFYSVAEHCINLALIVPNHLKGQALFHECNEAYYDSHIDLQQRIFKKFGLPIKLDKTIIHNDLFLHELETKLLITRKKISFAELPENLKHQQMVELINNERNSEIFFKQYFLKLAKDYLNVSQ